jgi:hypothetical protein
MGESDSSRNKLMLFGALVLGAGPIVAALIRVVQTGTDFRYLWVALASFVGATAVMSIGRANGSGSNALSKLSVVAFLVATLMAVLAARLLGARALPGIVLVAIVYAIFFTGSQVLFSLSRRRES